MTAPVPTEPTAAVEAAIFTQTAVTELVGLTKMALAQITRIWVNRVGPVPTRAPDRLPPDVEAQLESWLRALIEGMILAEQAIQRALPSASVSRAGQWRRDRLHTMMQSDVLAGRTLSAVQAALAQPDLMLIDMRGIVSETLVGEHTQSVHDEVRDLGSGWGLVWVAERDACVWCQRYAGRTIRSGEVFPGGISFGRLPKDAADVPGPPRHRNCRCELQPVYLPDAKPITDALQREAERSILKGWRRPSESNKQRVRAAQRLIRKRLRIGQTVRDEAERRLRKDPDSFGRELPS